MLNMYTMRKYVYHIIATTFGAVSFFAGMFYYSWLGAFGFFFCALLLNVIIGNTLLSHPLRRAVEGSGIMVWTLDSTGVIQPFIVKVAPPRVNGWLKSKWISTIWDRNSVFMFNEPKEGTATIDDKKGEMTIKLNSEKYVKSRFATASYPCFFYNQHTSMLLTKEMLSDFEKSTTADHVILLMNKLLEEANSILRDFTRHTADLLKPKQSLLQSKWFWIVLIGGLVLIGALIAPTVIKYIGGMTQTASLVIPTATITPR